MSLICVIIFAFSVFEVLNARQTNVDINRLKIIPNSLDYPARKQNNPASNQFHRHNNDNIEHISQHSLPYRHYNQEAIEKNVPNKVYQPKEDPRLFYQSDSYIKETGGTEKVNDVSMIYPGKDVVRASENSNGQKSARIMNKRGPICVRCPHDRTLIAKVGTDRVLFQSPKLISCSGRVAPRNVHFIPMYGPKFGSLIRRGSHVVVGRITQGKKTVQHCKMQVHVITQGCITPNYLLSHCKDDLHPSRCNFTCRDTRLQLSGETSLVCGDDLKWQGELPVCGARTWCEPPAPPDHGRVSCHGKTLGTAGNAVAEGSKCKVSCQRGWKPAPRAIICRRGVWTKALTCQKRNYSRT